MNESSKGMLVLLWMFAVPQLIWGVTCYLFPPEGVTVTYESFLPMNEDLFGVYRPFFWCLMTLFCVSPFVFDYYMQRQIKAWEARVIQRGESEDFWGCKYAYHAWYFLESGESLADAIPDLPIPPPGVLRERIMERNTIRICRGCHRTQKRVMDCRGCLSISDPPDYYWVDVSKNLKQTSNAAGE